MTTVINPYPPDGDTNGASPDVVLTWQAGEDAAATGGYDVYFGTDHKAVVKGQRKAHVGRRNRTTYRPSARLMPKTTYYWRVDEVSAENDRKKEGPLWSFEVFDGAGQREGYEHGYATWAVNTMTPVNLSDALPDGLVSPPSVSVKLARCESTGFQLAIQPGLDRRLDRVRVVITDLIGAGNVISASNLSWQVVGVIKALHDNDRTYPDVLLPVTRLNAATNKTHSILVTVRAPAGAVAGVYTGTITIKTDSGLDSAVTISATVHDFAIPAARSIGAMNLRNTWTLHDWGNGARYQAYGDLLLSYRMGPDNIYRHKALAPPDVATLVATLEHWLSLGLNTFSILKADNLWHARGLAASRGVDNFFSALAASPHGDQLRRMAQFYGYDEKGPHYTRGRRHNTYEGDVQDD